MDWLTDKINWVPIAAVSLALMLSGGLALWVVKHDEPRTPWIRDFIVAVLFGLMLAAAGIALRANEYETSRCREFRLEGA